MFARTPSLAVLTVAVALLAGCGSSDDPATGGAGAAQTTPNGAPQLTAAQQAQQEKFRACLAKNGITLPSGGRGRARGQGRPPGSGTGTTTTPAPTRTAPPAQSAAMQKAFAACAELMPQRGAGGPGGGPGGGGPGGGGYGGPPPVGAPGAQPPAAAPQVDGSAQQ